MSLTSGLSGGLTDKLNVLGSSVGVGGAFSPASLPGFVTSLLPALSRSQGRLWQDAGKTTAASANGDKVYVPTCPFSGLDWAAISNATRMTLTGEGGAKWSLAGDGAAAKLLLPAVFGTGDFFLAARVLVTADSGLLGSSLGSNRQIRALQTGNNASSFDGSSNPNSGAMPGSFASFQNVYYSMSGSTITFYQGTTSYGTGTYSNAAGFDQAFAFFTSSNALAGRCAAFILSSTAQSPSAALDSYMSTF